MIILYTHRETRESAPDGVPERRLDGAGGVDTGPFLFLPAREEDRDLLQPAERTRRFGQLRLPLSRGGTRLWIGLGQRGKRMGERGGIGEANHVATFPWGGTRTMKWPFTPAGQFA